MTSLRIIAARIERGDFSVQLDLEILPGSSVAVIGANGSGKSSLIEALAGFLPLASGSMSLPAGPLGYVPQDGLLIPHLSVAQNIAFGRGASMADVTAIGSDLRLNDLMERLPNKLSGGEQQRVALARALVRRPTLLLLDEPLSKVDAELRRLNRDVIDAWKTTGQITLVVTHGADHARECDQVLALKDGRAVAYGPPAELIASPPAPWIKYFFA